MSKTWFITGVSTGLGRAIAEAALAAGQQVAGTLRKEAECKAFNRLAPYRSHGILLDVTDTANVAPAIHRVERDIGPIDILVNNAGYGHEGLIEDTPLEEGRRLFDVNFFGVAAVIQAALPYMRQRRSGRIINITSMAGMYGAPNLGFYSASKFALEGLSEALSKEVRSLGIYVTAIEPGGFRTDWAGRSMAHSPCSIQDYSDVISPLRERLAQVDGHQLGDPKKAAAVLLKLIELPDPPIHLPLGSDARRVLGTYLETLRAEFDYWHDLTVSTDFADS